MAGNGGVGGISITGGDLGDAFGHTSRWDSAYGGRATSDGVSGISVLLSNTRTDRSGARERIPHRVRRFELIRDSPDRPVIGRPLTAPRMEVLVDDAAAHVPRRKAHRAAGRNAGGKPAPLAR